MNRSRGLLLLFLFGLVISLGRIPAAEAGIFNSSEEVTYKEYWMPHKEFTAGCTADNVHEKPNGNSWYAEPDALNKCAKTMLLNIPDNISGALKAELYVDLWRNYDTRSARLVINNHPTKVYASPVGYDWSRTPWIEEIPLNELVSGNANSFKFWGASGKYHIHDVALRVYYDDTHPIIPGGDSDVTPPDGQLLTIQSIDPGQPIYNANDVDGVLQVDQNKIKLTASATYPGADLVEFHAYYDGYDDDNDGETRDWHNVGRNNWWPGGANNLPTGQYNGTINHIGTVKVTPQNGGNVEITWDMPHVVNQAGVRFKIRIYDAAGNVRDAAGGASAPFKLVRTYPVVSYTMPNFDDFGLHMSGNRPDVVSYTFPLPANFSPSQYQQAMLLGMYWRNPKFAINGSSTSNANTGGADYTWSLGIASVTPGLLKAGNNDITYYYANGAGNFIEHPGPMIVLQGQSTGADIHPPAVVSHSPAASETNVDVFRPIVINMTDNSVGIDYDTIIMTVGGQLVEPVLSNASNNLTITYTPQQPYTPLSTVPVTIYGCDLFDNCMNSAVEFSFTAEPPDITPPVITNVNALTTESTAVITWHTDEGADSMVEYGLTTGYEKPTVSDSALLTQHSLELVGLTANTTYNFRISSTDFSDNTATTTNLTFTTKRTAGGIISDDFSGCSVDTSVWSYVNPRNDSVLALTGSGAQISVPAGLTHDIWSSGLTAPRLMQNVNNPELFDVEVKFDATLNSRTQTMGLMVNQDDGNWLRFNFQFDGSKSTIVAADSNKGKTSVLSSTEITLGSTNYMRLNRLGPIWSLQYSGDGNNWTSAATITRTLTVAQLGPFVGNSGNNPAFVGTIDYFENLDSPLSGQDTAITLNVEKVGVGEVTRTPDKPNYLCGETVTLAASAAPPWSFAGWSGAVTSASPTVDITMNQSETVVATFSNPTPYVLALDVVSNGDGVGGTISKSPDQETYLYGDQVQLTATPTAGWSFTGWTGSWTGTELTPTVTIIGDMAITATFDEDEYTIQPLVLSEGVGEGGTITIEPLQDTYLYGDVVTLTANINPGWSFDGWDINGVEYTSPSIPITMTESILAVARIVQSQYDLNITLNNVGDTLNPENGVLRDPLQETYGYGQVVTLTASPDLGWQFTGWGGALSGTELTKTLFITDDVAIDATFTQDKYLLNVTVDGPGAVTVEPQKDYYLYGEAVVLKPVPEQGYEFALWTGDLTTPDDPLIMSMQKDMTLEAVFVEDTTPIEIVSQSVEVHGLVAVVRWTTDVPGTSRVDYGEDEFYQDGSEQKEDLVTEHTIQLKNLKGDTRYHYQIISLDEFGNQVQSEDLTFFTGTSSGLVSDDFSSCELLEPWTWVMPQGDGSSYTMAGQQVEISVPARDSNDIHDIFTTGINVPRLMQSSNDRDFTVEVKFETPPSLGGTMQGIVVEQDGNNFLRFSMHRNALSEVVVYAATFNNLTASNVKSIRITEDVTGPIWVRVVRAGDDWEYWYSLDGSSWTAHSNFTFEVEVKSVGMFAGNTKSQGILSPHTAVVDYFFNTAAIIDPEDSYYQLNFEFEGSGMVQKNPNKSGFYCGEQVTLTAVPNTGWSFDRWEGDVVGTNSVQTITVNKNMTMKAIFQQGAVQRQLMLPVVLKN